MVLVADALVLTLNTNWGAFGGGGAKPTIANLDAYKGEPNPRRGDAVFVWLPQSAEIKQVNEKYKDVRYELRVVVETKTSSERIEQIGGEVERIITNYAIDGCDIQYIENKNVTTDRREPLYKMDFKVIIRTFLEQFPTSYGTGSSTTFTVENLEATNIEATNIESSNLYTNYVNLSGAEPPVPTVLNEVNLGIGQYNEFRIQKKWSWFDIELGAGFVAFRSQHSYWRFQGQVDIDSGLFSTAGNYTNLGNTTTKRWGTLFAKNGNFTENIVVDGTVDGVDIATFKSGYDGHIVDVSAHHTKTTAGEISLNDLLEKNHASLANIGASDHHIKTTAGELNLADMAEKSYNSLTDVPASFTPTAHNRDYHTGNIFPNADTNHVCRGKLAITHDGAYNPHWRFESIQQTAGNDTTGSFRLMYDGVAENILKLVNSNTWAPTHHRCELVSKRTNAPAAGATEFILRNSDGSAMQTVFTANTNQDVEFTQNLLLSAGKTVDGVDISAHAADASAHHVKTTSSEILLNDLGEKNHASLAGVSSNQHHNQSHAFTGADHTASGLTTGHFLKATGATTFGFAVHGLNHSDLGSIGSSDHHLRYALTEDLTSGEIAQLQNINSVTITNTQWGYLGASNQGIATTNSPTFAGLTVVNAINEFSTDGTLAGDSDSAVPTEKAVKTYVDASGGGDISGSGTVHYIPKFTATKTIGNSTVSETLGSLGGIDNLTMTGILTIGGDVNLTRSVADVLKFAAGDSLKFNIGATVNEFSTDGTLADNSDTAVPTEQAVKTYVDNYPAELKNLTDAEIQQLQNINAVTISNAQWGYLGALDQGLTQASSPTFVGLTLSGAIATPTNITMSGTLTIGADVALSRSVANVLALAAGDSLTFASGGATINEFSTDGTLAGNSDLAVPTEKATKKYVDDTVAAIGAGDISGSGTANRMAKFTAAKTIGDTAITENAGALSGITTLSMNNQLTNTLATGTRPLNVSSTTVCTNLNADYVDGLHQTAFLLANATRGVSANWDIGNYQLRAMTFYADVATGTAPLTIASTTKVTNLNADKVDGIDAVVGTSGRLMRSSSTTAIGIATVTESAGALGGITNLTMSGNLTNGSDTISLAQIADALMWGSANASYVPCQWGGTSQPGKMVVSGDVAWSNVDSTNQAWMFTLPLEPLRGALKLYVSGIRIGLRDADSNDYIDRRRVFGLSATGGVTTIYDSSVSYTAPAEITNTFTAHDCSSYKQVVAWIDVVCTTAYDLDIRSVQLRSYYGT